MIEITFGDEAGRAQTTLTVTEVRLTGGALWSQLEQGLIAHYTEGAWKHRGKYYPRVCVTDACCLLFGIARDPSRVSDPIGVFSFTGATFRANGVAIAQYREDQDMWQGLIRPFWWTALRLVSAASVARLSDESRAVLLNPWDPDPVSVTLARDFRSPAGTLAVRPVW